MSTGNDEPIDVFISHADEERRIASQLKRGLENFDMNGFVAHEDIVGGTDWNPALIERIGQCDIFVALLSKAYRKADFTDQEAGIAFAMKKPLMPISLDGTMPYGFIKKFQAKKCLNGFDEKNIEEICNLIRINTDKGQKEINDLIDSLARARSWRSANAIASELFAHPKFTSQQINEIARAVINNFEVSGSWTAGPRSLEVLQKNWKEIDVDLQKELKPLMKGKQL